MVALPGPEWLRWPFRRQHFLYFFPLPQARGHSFRRAPPPTPVGRRYTLAGNGGKSTSSWQAELGLGGPREGVFGQMGRWLR